MSVYNPSERERHGHLDELPPASPDQFEMAILELSAAKPEAALDKARAIVPRLQRSNVTKQVRRMLIQFIETVIVHQFPTWSRAEIEKMLQVTDVRQTRVFQEALEEGRQEGREQGIESVARRMIELGRTVTEIAQATGLTVAQVRKLAKKPKK